MTKAERYKNIFEWFAKNKPNPQTELHYNSPFQLLVAVILSAQCTDKRVNLITPKLFTAYPTAISMIKASVEEIFVLIKSCSYPNSKAKYLLGVAKALTERYNGIIPDTVDELEKLPGVGRKTANVIASIIYKKPTLAVDTHVFRVAQRLGLSSNAKTPLETEKQLMKNIPNELIPNAHHWLILHGRYICIARKPKCGECGIAAFCKYLSTKATT